LGIDISSNFKIKEKYKTNIPFIGSDLNGNNEGPEMQQEIVRPWLMKRGTPLYT
jgi:hypothetical protein